MKPTRRDQAEAMEAELFVLRTPFLPFEALLDWSEGLAAPTADTSSLAEALAADRTRLRERLARWVAEPAIAEALYIASPSIHAALGYWHCDPDSRKGRRCERALVRYFARMTSRVTPFGLFAGSTLGEVGTATRLELVPRDAYRRRSRLDLDYVYAVAAALESRGDLARGLTYVPNSSLYAAAGSWHYVETRHARGRRTYHLVEVEASDYLDALIRHAAENRGVGPEELAAFLTAVCGPEDVSLNDARDFVDELITSQVLISDLPPPLTGDEPDAALAARLERLTAPRESSLLSAARSALAELDAGGLGAKPEAYSRVADTLDGLPVQPERNRLCQVDLYKDAVQARLGPRVLDEIRRGVTLLHSLHATPWAGLFEDFRRAFVERYGEDRDVPLNEVLDEELGIGFERSAAPGAEASPLLAGLDFSGPDSAPRPAWGKREDILLRRLQTAWEAGETVLELRERDVEELTPDPPLPPLPDAFHVVASVAAASEQALDRGDFQVLLSHASGPSGARLLGRFCHGDPRMRRAVEEHLRREEACQNDAVFAEVVHLPQERMGNVLARPLLRAYEIPFLGSSGAPPEHQITVDDLRLAIRHDRLELRSARLGRRVVPRLTSAHDFESLGLAPYRLLSMLQNQGVSAGVYWSWGALESAAFLPAVKSGRLLLARMRWRLTAGELGPLHRLNGAERFRAVQSWRESRRLPRWLTLGQGDRELTVDLDNVLSVDSFLDATRGQPVLVAHELFPDPRGLVVRGPEGRFTGEMVIPFVRGEPQPKALRSGRPVPLSSMRNDGQRSFLPGSQWLYAKLYTGPANADKVLSEVVAPLARQVAGAGADIFFIRYGDPDWHLRLRFRGQPEALTGTVLPRLLAAVAPLAETGVLHRLQFDTYERETERYGGPRSIALAERLFAADSKAVLHILEQLEDDGSARWRLALLGIDRLFDDFGLSKQEKAVLARDLSRGAARLLGTGKRLRLQLDRRFRNIRRELEALLTGARGGDGLESGRVALAERSRHFRPIVAELRRREAAGELDVPVAELVPSLAHLHVNRLVHASAQAHERVLYDFLRRLYESALARAGR